MPELHTPRLLLRRWREPDREPFAAMNADPEVARYLPAPLDRAQSDALLDRVEAGFDVYGFGLWAVQVRDTAELAGFTGLSVPLFEAPWQPSVEVGWRLAPHFWGRGYATEAATVALGHGFQALGLAHVVSFTAPANTRSVGVMSRLGMTRVPDGDFEHPRLPAGHPLRRHVTYRVQRADWQRWQERRAAGCQDGAATPER